MDRARIGGVPVKRVLHIDGAPLALENVAQAGEELHFTLNGKSYRFRVHPKGNGAALVEEETAPGQWRRAIGHVAAGKGFRRVQVGALEARISETPSAAVQGAARPLSPPAPMPGLVRQVLVSAGEKVMRDQPLVVLEAMKLQLTLTAGGEGTVEAVLAKPGEMVAEGAELVRVKAS